MNSSVRTPLNFSTLFPPPPLFIAVLPKHVQVQQSFPKAWRKRGSKKKGDVDNVTLSMCCCCVHKHAAKETKKKNVLAPHLIAEPHINRALDILRNFSSFFSSLSCAPRFRSLGAPPHSFGKEKGCVKDTFSKSCWYCTE